MNTEVFGFKECVVPKVFPTWRDIEAVSLLGDAMFEELNVPHIWVETVVSTNMKLNRKKIRYIPRGRKKVCLQEC